MVLFVGADAGVRTAATNAMPESTPVTTVPPVKTTAVAVVVPAGGSAASEATDTDQWDGSSSEKQRLLNSILICYVSS
eukprot:COSAG02_NODE_9229_length_2283_cov_1.529304_1_plen_77_part_10